MVGGEYYNVTVEKKDYEAAESPGQLLLLILVEQKLYKVGMRG